MLAFKKSYSILILLFLLACNNDDDNNQVGQQIVTNDTSSTSGQLTVRTNDINGNPLDGVRVTLYASFEDLNNDIWLYQEFNRSNGEVNFGFINIGTYYIFAERFDGSGSSITNSPGDAVQVRSQRNEYIIVQLK